MFESYYKVIAACYIIFDQLINGMALAYLCAPFVSTKRVKRKLCLVGAVYFITVMTLYYMPYIVSNFFAYFTSIAAAFFVLLLLDRENKNVKIVLCAMFFTLRWTVHSVVLFISMCIDDNLISPAIYHSKLSSRGKEICFLIDFVISDILEIIFLVLCYLILIRAIHSLFADYGENIELKELFLLLLPTVIGMICYQMKHMYSEILMKETGKDSLDYDVTVDVFWTILQLIICAAIIGTLFLYQYVKREKEKESERQFLESDISSIKNHIEEVEKIYAEIRGIRHDIGNHVQIMEELLERGNVHDVKEYLASLKDRADSYDFTIKTSNPVTDVILGENQKKSAELGIRFDCDFNFPANTGIDVFDISVVLTNALSNAIEAAGKDGWVSVSSFRRHNAYLITVENSYEGDLSYKEGHSYPDTGKTDKKQHGFGIKNIRTVAEKYYGNMSLRQQADRVVLTVMLMERD